MVQIKGLLVEALVKVRAFGLAALKPDSLQASLGLCVHKIRRIILAEDTTTVINDQPDDGELGAFAWPPSQSFPN